MWWGLESDPGGTGATDDSQNPSENPSSAVSMQGQELSELEDQEKEKLVEQLKEMLRRTDPATTASLEKAEKLADTLTRMQSRAKRNKQKKLMEQDENKTSSDNKATTSRQDTPGKEKINLLRKQLEENKMKLAERDKRQKEKVTQLKAQLDDSQALFNQSIGNLSQKATVTATTTVKSYTLDNTKEELLSILTDKDRQMNDLNARIQQLEANVLDLQENVKEKDSVIKARTKAITLMSEDLSRRGKSTLDMLDETKTQMRLMQENFIKMESDMKAEKDLLIEQLKSRDKYIMQLEETTKSLQSTVDEYTKKESKDESQQTDVNDEDQQKPKKMKRLENELEELRNENLKLCEQVTDLKKTNENSDEVERLTKQLDEMNKNMIKLKAQNKSKIKELQKQIDVFKKADQVNDELLKVNSENNKLKHKIAELEEEKGNLQLNLVDYDAKKVIDTNLQETVDELKQKLEQLQSEIKEKDQIIIEIKDERDKLINELESSRTESDALKNRILELSAIETEQVQTQMTSAQLEEQIDQLKVKNADLMQQVATISKENIALHDRIEMIIVEKQELNTKLENLIHENMDLVDRLEKLSAEKVSSAESIEIVESLTQQEKLEMEEFNQKYSNEPPDSDVVGMHELEQNPELNDSVAKLTEESAELMEKIELFTIERKEVMEKMELLSLENGQLMEKLKILEQEKYNLEETYETLVDEKMKLEQDLENLKLQRLKTSTSNDEQNDESHNIDHAMKEVENYQKLIEQQKNEIETLKIELDKSLKQCQEFGIEKATIEESLQQLTKENNDINNKNTSLQKKIATFEDQIDELEKVNFQLKQTLDLSNKEIDSLKLHLNTYQVNDDEIKTLQNEIVQLTQLLSENGTKLELYEHKMEENTKLIDKLNSELSEFNEKFQTAEILIKEKDNYIAELEEEKEQKNLENIQLKHECDAKNQQIQKIIGDFQNKYKQLESKITMNTESLDDIKKPLQEQIIHLEEQCNSLENKNREQLEKMKKIAAHLKKKVQQCEELEKDKELAINKITELENELKQTNNNLKLNTDELIKTRQHFDAQQAKHQEQEMVIENLEQEKLILLNKNAHFEETIQLLEQTKQKLQYELIELNEKLQEKSLQLDETTLTVRTLENEIVKSETKIKELLQRIDELTNENRDLQEQNKMSIENVHTLQLQLNSIEEKYNREQNESIEQLEELNTKLASELMHLENDLKRVQGELKNEKELKQQEIEKLESESSLQYIEFDSERKRLLEQNERLIQESNTLKLKMSEIESENKFLSEQNKELILEINKLNETKTTATTTTTNKDDIESEMCEKKRVVQFNMAALPSENFEQLKIEYDNLLERYKSIEEDYRNLATHLQNEIEQSKDDVVDHVKQQAVHEVTKIITQAETTVGMSKLNELEKQNIELMNQLQQLQQSTTGNEQHDLNEKIKTLQFMLHDSEKTKDDILEICQEVVNEIIRREYEQKLKTPPPQQEHKSTEITPERLSALEADIVSEEFTKSIDAVPKQNQTEPNDEIIICKKAYKCYDEDQQQQQQETAPIILDVDDNLWGSEEAALEEAHMQTTNTNEFKEKIKILESERDQLHEENKMLQVRSAKMLKKLKELKEKNEQLNNQMKKQSSFDNFGDLDRAIEDELKLQIQSLEKIIRDLKQERDKDHAERENLVRQIDVLTTANERMVEMKEKQDVEVQIWQMKNRELQAKLDELDWSNDGFSESLKKHEKDDALTTTATTTTTTAMSSAADLQKQIVELQTKLNELSIDNEELQCLLEEQVQLRNEIEKKLLEKQTHENVQQLWDDYNKVVSEKNQLLQQLENIPKQMSIEELDQIQQEKNEILTERDTIIKEKDAILNERNQIMEEKEAILNEKDDIVREKDTILKEKIEILEELTNVRNDKDRIAIELNQIKQEMENLRDEHSKLVQTLETVQTEKMHLEQQLQQMHEQSKNVNEQSMILLQQEKENIEIKYHEIVDELKQIQDQLQKERQEKITLQEHSNNLQIEKEKLVEELKQKYILYDELSKHKENTDIQLKEKQNEYDLLQIQMTTLTEQIEKERQEAELKLKTTIEQLVAEIDKRGADVAESWKLHLDAREYEFVQLEQILRTQIQTLETKYNTLMEQKTETEIQHHEQQILNDELIKLKEKLRDYETMTNENEKLKEKIIFYENELKSLNTVIETKDAKIERMSLDMVQLKEKLSHLEEKLNDLNNVNNQISNDNEYLKEKMKQDTAEHAIQMQSLNIAINMKDKEIEQLKEEIKLKENERNILENEQLQLLENKIEQLKALLSENETKYTHLMSEKEMHLEQLREEIVQEQRERTTLENELSSEIQQLKLKNSETEQQYKKILLLINEKEQKLEELNDEINQLQVQNGEIEENYKHLINEKENELLQDRERLETYELEINHLKTISSETEQKYIKLLSEKETIDQTYNETIRIKQNDLDNLHIQLQTKMDEYKKVEEQLTHYTAHYQEELTIRDNNIANLKLQLEAKEKECNELQNKIIELDYIINEDTKQISDLKDIIENQVLKIEELKNIEKQSNTPPSTTTEKHVHFPEENTQLVTQHYYEPSLAADEPLQIIAEDHNSSLQQQQQQQQQQVAVMTSAGNIEFANKAELELALYMLHQRDVLCEELTVELTQLLEERDTLQLKLSNAIRMNEELRRKLSPKKLSKDTITDETALTTPATTNILTENSPTSTTSSSSSSSTTPRKSSNILIGATDAEIDKEAIVEQELVAKHKNYLENKLSELHSVDYRRDVRLKDEQETRHLQQLSLMQSQRDLAMLPPEAAARLVDANYTLSRESESASTVLLNWFWGRSTPKVNHL